MVINLDNLFNSKNKDSKTGDFQDLDHIDGLSISTTSANLYGNKRDDLVLFYFRNGANYASVYTQSKIVSENLIDHLDIEEMLMILRIWLKAFLQRPGKKNGWIDLISEDQKNLMIQF